ncbi:hypothetical protein P3W45_001779, partial [Vairimorpha bombi]
NISKKQRLSFELDGLRTEVMKIKTNNVENHKKIHSNLRNFSNGDYIDLLINEVWYAGIILGSSRTLMISTIYHFIHIQFKSLSRNIIILKNETYINALRVIRWIYSFLELKVTKTDFESA